MSQEKMRVVHQLIEDRNYLEARGILEAEPDIDPRTAEKWLAWLDDVQREERRLAGVGVDKKKQNPQRAFTQLVQVTLGMLCIIVASVPTWLWIEHTFNYQTASIYNSGFFMLMALIWGGYGWLKVGGLISPSYPIAPGGGIAFVLVLVILSSGFPLWFYHEPPLIYLLAAFALLFPIVAFISGHLGLRLGAGLLHSWQRVNRVTD